MNDDTVRHLWSDAELDAALAALHPHEGATDRAELDRARASLMRAAAAASESDEPVVPQQKSRSGAWRWIAVAAAVALLTGGVVVVRELASAPTTLAPAGPGSPAERPEAGAPFTHVVTEYSRTALVGGTSVFRVREQADLWIPADESGVWKRRWTRAESPTLLGGDDRARAKLDGPSQAEESAPGGRFAHDSRFPGESSPSALPGWFHPTPEFVASLPTDTHTLTGTLLKESSPPRPPTSVGPLPQPVNYGAPKIPAPISYPSATGLILNVLASGYASRELRGAFQKVMDNPSLGFEVVQISPDFVQYAAPAGPYRLLVSVDRTRAHLTDIQALATSPATGFAPGTLVSSARFSYQTTDRAGD
ncbi:hypothetical protein CU254_36000 [Amycolatopsis sp. AA4]|uniref:hypothetical protein n=1 Tax=Actinomycetes TaxID=1760 RepID=UPI0001B56BD4|nr:MULTISPECIES: hypothetical protein [Actinomycetes]ATY15202.1 hypothetical protein CU254_36000 [Amycolatopsis sp. AA4]EFL11423.1 predicted protein [Streptomyces sp. AA4]